MKKFTLLSLFSILFMLSNNTSASTTLTWTSQSETLSTNSDLSPELSTGNSSTVHGSNNKLGFLSDRNPLNYLGLDNWYVNEDLIVNLEENTIMLQAQTGDTYNIRTEDAEQVAITTTPIPAAIWLFGSALLGIGGLSSRKERP